MDILAALCDILECQPNDLIEAEPRCVGCNSGCAPSIDTAGHPNGGLTS